MLLPQVTLPGSKAGEGSTVAFITVLGASVPAAFAAVPSASRFPTAIGAGLIGAGLIGPGLIGTGLIGAGLIGAGLIVNVPST